MKSQLSKIIAVFVLVTLSVPAGSFEAQAAYFFNPHFIISDEEMADYQSLTRGQIQQFLKDNNSGLTRLITTNFEGFTKSAADIIADAAIESQINPKVLLTTLQKEQSLIGDPNPTQRQIDRAMGYRCPDSGSCHPNTLDFGKQVDGAAWQFRQYLDAPLRWTFQAGNQYEIDGYLIRPANTATAGLYNYTPHYSGNERFWRLWVDYWGRNFPDGSLVKAPDSPAVWLIQYGVRRLITSYAVLLSRFNPQSILTISRSDLEKYEIGPSIKFSNFSLLQSPDGKIYLVVDDYIRHITSPEVFRTIGYNIEEVEPIDDADLAAYQLGDPITLESIHPTGALLQDNTSGGVFFVQDGLKHPIYSRELMKANYPNRILTQVSPEELDQYQTGSPVKFRDGTLVRASNDSKVYVIANGIRRWVQDEAAFANFGYKWDNIITTSQQAVLVHELGEPIE